MKKIDVLTLKAKIDKKEIFTLLDVREPHELAVAKIDPHTHIAMGSIPMRHQELEKGKPIIVMCHSGGRSAQVCHYLEQRGCDVSNLEGGIDAWSQLVDQSVPRY